MQALPASQVADMDLLAQYGWVLMCTEFPPELQHISISFSTILCSITDAMHRDGDDEEQEAGPSEAIPRLQLVASTAPEVW